MRGWRWLNLWIPLALSYTVAAYAGSLFGGVAYAAVFIVVWIVAYYPAVAVVGLVTGLVGHAPREQSLVFGRGFAAGYRMLRG